MNVPEATSLLSFRRTFTLLMVLVVLPSAGVSGFGVVAIVNERAAVEKRLESVWLARLAGVQTALTDKLKQARVVETKPMHVDLGGRALTGDDFEIEKEAVEAGAANATRAAQSLVQLAASIPEEPIFLSGLDGRNAWLVVAVRRGSKVFGTQIAPSQLDVEIDSISHALLPSQDQARLSLLPVQREPREGVVARFLTGVNDVKEAALGQRELASLPLEAPLQEFRLVAFALGEDPVAQASTRNRIWYGVLLFLFYVILIVGVVFTGRALYREARLSRMKTDFVSLVSHELRTPLTSIRMFIEMLEQKRVQNETQMQSVLSMLSQETARLSSMIERVLDWSRIEQGKKRYLTALCAPQLLVDTASAAFRAQRLGTDMTLSTQVEPDLPLVRIDQEAIAGALLNLLQNAYKYSGPQRVITLTASRAGKMVSLSVTDNGIGIPRRELKRIFERFYRVDSLLSRSTEGSGLGLSISERIVRDHGGRIAVSSTEGGGSTFAILLPVAKQ
jgi:two-component system, OmpR family, phosphate regulon sensor histidine kinase PhoR